MSCLAGCASNYSCGRLKKPIDGHSISPYVKIFFGDASNPDITVGNESSPKFDHTAAIKSFEFGSSNGTGFKAEIIDSQGGAFHLFIDKLNKCMEKASTEYKMHAEWGWTISNCDGSKDVKRSPKVTVLPIHCETLFEQGKVKFIIEGSDLMQHVFAARHDVIKGDDENRMHLKDAIRQLAQDTEPKFDVKFIKRSKDGTESPLKFKEGGENGPKDVWACDGQNKLATIQKWLEPFLTEDDKGIVPLWDSREEKPTVIFMQDPTPSEGEGGDACSSSLGTYIVNGGSCSPVIRFSPKLNWAAAFSGLASGGNSGGAASGESIKKEKDLQTPETGIQQSIPITSAAWNVYGPKKAVEETEKAQNAQEKANAVLDPGLKPIEAELVVQGDPSEEFIHTPLSVGKTISLVVINPFHLLGSGPGCGDWLAQPGCNQILSNKAWQVMGFSHSIKEGSYTTTMKILLASPGIHFENGEFGGAGSGGYQPTNAC
jgi:hypothetical protein